jgi:glycosyltransferase involved in cell wall biosynthesis
MMDIVVFTPDLSNNSLGRTLCIWQLAVELGWTCTVVSTAGNDMWPPVIGTRFADSCILMPTEQMATSDLLKHSDLFIAIKPLASSFGIALDMSSRHDVPLLLDIDDPDLEVVLNWRNPIRRIAFELLRRPKMVAVRKLAAAAHKSPTMVSNPVLQARYGGPIIPHIRADIGPGSDHVRDAPTVAFVGSNNAHKGLPQLRKAVASVQDLGYLLVVTDNAPADAMPWERWTGRTSLEEGTRLVGSSDIVVIPSLNKPFARGQLPAKLIDAMILGRAVVVTKIQPMPWALGTTGTIIRPGSVKEIARALRKLSDPLVRERSGKKARARALEMFTSSASLAKFEQAALDTVDRHRRHSNENK